MGVRIDELNPTGLAGRDYVVPAMKGGVTAKLTVGQLLDLLVDAAPGSLDTLNELAAALGDDPNFAATVAAQMALKASAADVTTALAGKLSVGAQSLTVTQQLQVQKNIGSFANQYLAKGGTYTITDQDNGAVILASASAAAVTIMLPAASGRNGFKITVQKSDSSINAVTLDGNASEVINGSLTYSLRLPNQSVTIYCNGTEWFVTNEAGTVERGTGANGSYERHANGTLRCWIDTFGVTVVGGTLNTSASWTFPYAFSVAPSCQISVRSTSVTNAYSLTQLFIGSLASSATVGINASVSQQYRLDLTADGFWY